MALKRLQANPNKTVTVSDINNLVNSFVRGEAHLNKKIDVTLMEKNGIKPDKATVNSDTKKHHKKFGHRVKKLGKDMHEKVKKALKNAKEKIVKN